MTLNSKLNEVSIEITKACPLNCKMCSTDASPEAKTILNFKILYKIVNQAKEMGFETISISGGEPFTHPDFIELCRLIKRKDLKLLIYTCGNVPDFRKDITPIPVQIFKELKSIGTEKIIFNLQSMNQKVHDSITGVIGSHINVLESLKTSIKSGIYTEVHYIPMRMNYSEIRILYRNLKSLGVNCLSLLRFVPHGRGGKFRSELEMDKSDFKVFKNQVQKIRKKSNGFKFRIGNPLNAIIYNSNIDCTAGIDKLLIRPDGKVFPCVALKNLFSSLEANCNDISKNNLSEIWTSSLLFKEFRNLSNEGKRTSSKIKGCPAQKLLSSLKNNFSINLSENVVESF